MGPYDFGSISGGSSSSSSSSPPMPKQITEIDGMLAGAGYRVRTAELRQVAHRLERLETAMVNSPSDLSHLSSDDVVHHNPADLASWVDSLLSEVHSPIYSNNLPLHGEEIAVAALIPDSSYSNPLDPYPLPCSANYADTTWADQISNQHPQQVPAHHYDQLQTSYHSLLLTVSAADAEQEHSGIRVVHLLLTCAESVQRGQTPLATALLEEMKRLLGRINTTCGIGKVAGYFIDALSRRLYRLGSTVTGLGFEHEILYHHFYEACPYLKFAHFTANQAILETFEGHDRVHVIDFSPMHGLQWPPLIQALALRPGGPPSLTITGIGPHERELQEVGLKLAQLALSVNVPFAFHSVAVTRGLEEVKPWMLKVDSANEAVAVNSILQLHRLLGSNYPTSTDCSIDPVLDWIHGLCPKIFTVVEQESDHNRAGFSDRFTEALYYYSTMFDSLEACQMQPEKALAEIYMQREICNIVCCEGSDRVERHEPLAKWSVRLSTAGFKPLELGSNAFKQASMLLTLFSAEGYCVEEKDGCLTLGWHSRPLISASAWQAEPLHKN